MCPSSRTIYSPLHIYPVMGLLGQMEFLFLRPWGIATLSSTMVELIYTPINSKSVPIPPHPLQHLLSPDFLMIAILTGMRSYLNVVLICIYLMTSDDEHFFICLLASCMSSLKSICSYSLPIFEWTCLFFSCKSVWVLCKFWISALCQMGKLQKFFSHSVGCRFTLVTVSFAVQKLWSLIRSQLSI